MVFENVTAVPVDVVLQMGQLVLGLQALGLVTLILFITTLISIFIELKKKKKLKEINNKLDLLGKKLDKLLSKR